MITVTIYKREDEYAGFRVSGHADYGEEGQDIVCAAVSALVLNTANSLEALTEDAYTGEEKDGYFDIRFPDPLSKEALLLIDSMVLGLTDLQQSYGNPYISIVFKEV